MPKVTYIEHNGTAHQVEVPVGLSVMRGAMEASMLSFAAAAEPNSRLSCQITMSEALAGLVVRMPEGQH